jgi:O-antigen/teichoic acid export membrane protein
MKNLLFSYLRRSEKYLKTDMVYLVGQGGWLLIGQAAVFVSSLLLAWFFANYIDPSDYGLYKYVLSIAALATITTLTGLSTALARAVSQGHNVSLPKLLKIRILFGLIGSAGLVCLSLYYISVDNTLLATLFVISAFWLPFYETLSDYQSLLQGKKDFKTQTILRIFQRLLLTLLVISSIIITSNIVIITFVFFASSSLSHYISLRIALKKYENSEATETPYDEIFSYGKKLSIQNIFYIGVHQLDKIILFKFLGPIQLAIYFFAIAIPQELNGLLGNISTVAFPKLVDKGSYEFKRALLKKIGTLTIILIVPVMIYIFTAPYIFEWLFPAYIEAVFISQLFIGTTLFIPMNIIWQYFYATNNQHALWFGTFMGPGVFILGILIFVPHYGLLGAIIAAYIRSVMDLFSGLYFFLRTKKDTETQI